MASINTRGVVVGGLVAGLIINVSEYILNEPVLGARMVDALTAHNLPPVGGNAIAVFVILGFVLGLVLVWLYAAIRPRFGARTQDSRDRGRDGLVPGLLLRFGCHRRPRTLPDAADPHRPRMGTCRAHRGRPRRRTAVLGGVMLSVNRRDVLRALLLAFTPSAVAAATKPSVSTLIGTGSRGQSDREVNNPYGLVIGPDRALYFCDLDNQRIRRLDFRTRRTTIVAGNGQKAYRGDGGPATDASLSMPHEIQFDSARNLYIAERDNHVVRKVDAKTGVISTFAGTGVPGFSGDGGPAAQAQLRQPHSIAVDRKGRLLICDIGNHRIRQVDISSGTIETYGGTGERLPTPDGAPVKGYAVERAPDAGVRS